MIPLSLRYPTTITTVSKINTTSATASVTVTPTAPTTTTTTTATGTTAHNLQPVPPPPGSSSLYGGHHPHHRRQQFSHRILIHGGPPRDTSIQAATRAKQIESQRFEKNFHSLDDLMKKWDGIVEEIVHQHVDVIESDHLILHSFLTQYHAAHQIQRAFRASLARWKLKGLRNTRFIIDWISFHIYYKKRKLAARCIIRIIHRYFTKGVFQKVFKMNQAAKRIQSFYKGKRRKYILFHRLKVVQVMKIALSHIFLFGRSRAAKRLLIQREAEAIQSNQTDSFRKLLSRVIRRRRRRYLRSPHGKLLFYILSQFYGEDGPIPCNPIIEYVRRKMINSPSQASASMAANKTSSYIRKSMRSTSGSRSSFRSSRSQPSPDSPTSPACGIQHFPSILQGVNRIRSVYDAFTFIQDMISAAKQHPEFLEDNSPPSPTLYLAPTVTTGKSSPRRGRGMLGSVQGTSPSSIANSSGDTQSLSAAAAAAVAAVNGSSIVKEGSSRRLIQPIARGSSNIRKSTSSSFSSPAAAAAAQPSPTITTANGHTVPSAPSNGTPSSSSQRRRAGSVYNIPNPLTTLSSSSQSDLEMKENNERRIAGVLSSSSRSLSGSSNDLTDLHAISSSLIVTIEKKTPGTMAINEGNENDLESTTSTTVSRETEPLKPRHANNPPSRRSSIISLQRPTVIPVKPHPITKDMTPITTVKPRRATVAQVGEVRKPSVVDSSERLQRLERFKHLVPHAIQPENVSHAPIDQPVDPPLPDLNHEVSITTQPIVITSEVVVQDPPKDVISIESTVLTSDEAVVSEQTSVSPPLPVVAATEAPDQMLNSDMERKTTNQIPSMTTEKMTMIEHIKATDDVDEEIKEEDDDDDDDDDSYFDDFPDTVEVSPPPATLLSLTIPLEDSPSRRTTIDYISSAEKDASLYGGSYASTLNFSESGDQTSTPFKDLMPSLETSSFFALSSTLPSQTTTSMIASDNDGRNCQLDSVLNTKTVMGSDVKHHINNGDDDDGDDDDDDDDDDDGMDWDLPDDVIHAVLANR